ncbi:hypothetical protein F9C07_12639 [Aspergillus flavus]|uniref:Uncharacterized protein n=1 Tax=Aspergillus flavus (strain ATCC 200026 / FGSC A1120 / IAM 13836 / NRRL 3357 / JCM 12722 / SRRC 167) TaxID=332952 RepID=A0A7U2MZG4_ASPFN|nr:hypothetical protein F9C07_12639 [Aspergillus flavus]
MTSSECQSLDSAQGYQTQYRLREYFGSYCTVPIKVLLVARILAITDTTCPTIARRKSILIFNTRLHNGVSET